MLRRLVADLFRRMRIGGSAGKGRADAARERGDWMLAANEYQDHLAKEPDDASAHNDLGIVWCELARHDEAMKQFSLALSLDPTLIAARINLGHLCLQTRAYREAVGHYQAVLAEVPDQIEARRQLCLAYYELGEVQSALECARPGANGHFDLLCAEYSLFMAHATPGIDHGAHFDDHLRWGKEFKAAAAGIPPLGGRPGRLARSKIRVGYVSADFREHAIVRFLLPVLEGHDRSSFDIYCYANQGESDAVTGSIRRLPLTWRDIYGLDDHQAATLIASDDIDVLIDVSGHTRGNRLGVFALRPARVQMSWLGYLNSSGLDTIDFRITDSAMDPIGVSEKFHREKLIRLDPAGWSYRPPSDAPDITSVPSGSKGHVTFGSFNHVAKLNDQVLECWSEIIDRCPGSRLKIAGVPDQLAAERLARPFIRRGIAADRIQVLPRMPRSDYFAQMAGVDLALDPFPYCGGATTCECLWMGLPVIALMGDFGFGRSSSAILAQAGLSGLAAPSREAYITRALELAKTGVTEFRRTIRDRMRHSDLMNEPDFVRRLEAAYMRSINGT
jgi:protein O-GlcNAc transferase